MAGEIILYGATLERSSDESTWTVIPGVTSITLPSVTQEYVETTSLDSTGGYREYIGGLKDAGEASFSQNYSRAAMDQADADDGVKLYYRMTLASPDGGATTGDVHEFEGIRTASPVTDDIGGLVRIDNTLRISGERTYTAGA